MVCDSVKQRTRSFVLRGSEQARVAVTVEHTVKSGQMRIALELLRSDRYQCGTKARMEEWEGEPYQRRCQEETQGSGTSLLYSSTKLTFFYRV